MRSPYTLSSIDLVYMYLIVADVLSWLYLYMYAIYCRVISPEANVAY